MTLYDFCIEQGRMELLKQWSNDHNDGLQPKDVACGSHRKVWWRCERGHEWKSAVYTRTGQDSGCPYCTNRKVLKGFNDLASLYPELAKQWHHEKNGLIQPDQVTCGSHQKVWWQKVWWRCEKGHEWQALIGSRSALHQPDPAAGGKRTTDLESQFGDTVAS